jgi:hypothetical protein
MPAEFQPPEQRKIFYEQRKIFYEAVHELDSIFLPPEEFGWQTRYSETWDPLYSEIFFFRDAGDN